MGLPPVRSSLRAGANPAAPLFSASLAPSAPALSSFSRRAQASLETLLMMGIVLAFIVPLVLLFFSSSTEKVSVLEQTQARALAQSLSDTAGAVWYNGNGSRAMVLVDFPNNLRDLTLSGDFVNDSDLLVQGHEISVSYLPPGGAAQDIVIVSPAPVRSLPPANDPRNQSKLAQRTAGPGSVLRSGLVVLIFQNNGTHVNILRKVQGRVE
ncbi:Uncharacterised protein [uncultured archaeon]|nr:Uncharacterised protein [uncultured archaeon]